MTDKHTNKGRATTKRTQVVALHRPALNNLSYVADYCDVDTPPASSTSDWAEVHAKTEVWGVGEAEVCEGSRVHLMVGSPKVLPRHESESMRQSQLLQGVWSSACADEAENTDDMRMLMSSQEGAEGHAHQMSEVGELDNMSSLAWPSQVQYDVPPMHALLNEAEMRVHRDPQDKEMDEVEWLRRTYETVYSPAARQRALDQLTTVKSSGTSKSQTSPAKPPKIASKSTVLYDFV